MSDVSSRLMIANLAAAVILVLNIIGLLGLFGKIENPEALAAMAGAAATFLFTENYVNGTSRRPSQT